MAGIVERVKGKRTYSSLILEVLDGRNGMLSSSIRKQISEITGEMPDPRAINKRLLDLYTKGWLSRWRRDDGRFAYRLKMPGGLPEDVPEEQTERFICKAKADTGKLLEEMRDITVYQVRCERRRTQIGDVMRVRVNDGTRLLRVIMKTQHLCVFEGSHSCQWFDVLMYQDGKATYVG